MTPPRLVGYALARMSTSTPISVRIAAAALAISFGTFVAACEKGGTSTTPPGDDEAADEGGEEPAADEGGEEEGGEEEDAGGW